MDNIFPTAELAAMVGLSSAKELNELLARDKIQYFHEGSWVLRGDYADTGLVKIQQIILENGTIIYNRCWTGTGRKFILDRYLK